MAFLDLFNQFGRKRADDIDIPEKKEESFAPAQLDDTVVIGSGGGLTARSINFGDQCGTDENALINAWRELSTRPEIDWAIQEVVNEAIVTDHNDFPVAIEFPESIGLPEKICDRLTEEFEHVLTLMNFNRTASDKFRQYYIDGRYYMHGIVDPKAPSKGLIAVRWIDPRTIKKIVETEKVRTEQGYEIEKIKRVYYQYTGFSVGRSNSLHQVQQAIQVHPDAIAYANSGIFREKGDGTNISISHLDKSLKTANQLRLLEDSLVIYRLARAPERLVFYVDTGNLPTTKSRQYLNSVKDEFNNKMVYDSTTGEVKDARNNLAMTENYWLARREGGRGTEVSTIQGGQNLGEMEDVDYFFKKLYKSLNIPSTRMDGQSTFSMGRSAEITREEVKFSKFISYLRSKFSEVFIQLLKIQVITKKIMDDKDFEKISGQIVFRWKTDSYWDELMNNEMWQSRVGLLQQIDQYVGTYFSQEWVKKNILNMTQQDIDDISDQIAKEPQPEPEDDF